MLCSLVPAPALVLLLVAFLASPAAVIGQEATPTATPVAAAAFVWQTGGGPDLTLDYPGQMAVAPDGSLWVPDGRGNVVQIFAPDGTFLEAWGEEGSGEGQFLFYGAGYGDGAIAFGADGTIYVAETGDGQFLDPMGIAVGADGRVYVVDDGRSDVQVFAPDGRFLFKFGGYGTGEGQFQVTGYLALGPDGDVWIADYGNNRIQRFAPDGAFVAAWGSSGHDPGKLLATAGVAVDDLGRVYVTEHDNDRVQVFDETGRMLAAWGGEGSEAGQFNGPWAIALDGTGHAYVGEDLGSRIQQFRLLPPLAPEATPAAGTPAP